MFLNQRNAEIVMSKIPSRVVALMTSQEYMKLSCDFLKRESLSFRMGGTEKQFFSGYEDFVSQMLRGVKKPVVSKKKPSADYEIGFMKAKADLSAQNSRIKKRLKQEAKNDPCGPSKDN